MNVIMFLLTNLLNGFLGIGFLLLGYGMFSKFTKWSFREVLDNEKSGFTGASIVIAAFLIGLSIIIAAAAF